MKKRNQKQAKSVKLVKPRSSGKIDDVREMQQVDEKVQAEGEKDAGQPSLKLCPRCGSMDLGFRQIDIPGFAPELQVCNRCGFRSEAAVEVKPIEYFEEVEDEESASHIEEIEKRLQRAGFGKVIEPKLKKKQSDVGKLPKVKSKSKPSKQVAKKFTKFNKLAKKKR